MTHSQDESIISWYRQGALLDRMYADFAQRYGISLTELRLLRWLREEPGLTQAQLCQALLLPKQTVSGVMTALRARGWLAEAADPEDRRRVRVSLSAQGEAFLAPMLADLGARERAAFACLPEETRREYTKVNEQLTQALGEKMKGGNTDV
ncbi:MAG: MarR family transcriptional regulator [Eubacteriales bacterium]|nr:MarR family transcriptional regulator [Eubacteriales bacterium]